MAIVNDEQVMKVLRQYNPWWRIPSAIKEESKPQKSIRRFAVLSGMRRVGKTTILYQIIDHLIDEGVNSKNILYASFDNPILKLVNAENVLSLYEAMYPAADTRYVLFDEVQYTENCELWIKVIYDSRKDIRLIATGSASPVLEKVSADSGTGRWSVLKIPTMSFYEYCRLLDLDLPLLPDDLRLSKLKSMNPAQLGYFRKAKNNQKEVDVVVELPRQKILCEVKYRNNSHIVAADAIIELCQNEKSKVTDAFLITKRLDDFGITTHETTVPILRVPATAFLYILGKTEAEGQNGKL